GSSDDVGLSSTSSSTSGDSENSGSGTDIIRRDEAEKGRESMGIGGEKGNVEGFVGEGIGNLRVIEGGAKGAKVEKDRKIIGEAIRRRRDKE
ncbi:unnamed protein product, partial [Citrullus colocynthis]